MYYSTRLPPYYEPANAVLNTNAQCGDVKLRFSDPLCMLFYYAGVYLDVHMYSRRLRLSTVHTGISIPEGLYIAPVVQVGVHLRAHKNQGEDKENDINPVDLVPLSDGGAGHQSPPCTEEQRTSR